MTGRRVSKQAPHLEYWASENGEFILEDTRDGEQYEAASTSELAQLIADLSATDTHVPVGDAIHKVTSFFGIKRCGKCAERQARLNRMIRRRR